MLVTRKSPFSGSPHTREIPCEEYQMRQYLTGQGYIQDIFPNLSADDREFIKTGITPEEWDAVFNTAPAAWSRTVNKSPTMDGE